MAEHVLDPNRPSAFAHEGDCLGTLCPVCGCCGHCADDAHCEGLPGCIEAGCMCPALGGERR